MENFPLKRPRESVSLLFNNNFSKARLNERNQEKQNREIVVFLNNTIIKFVIIFLLYGHPIFTFITTGRIIAMCVRRSKAKCENENEIKQ